MSTGSAGHHAATLDRIEPELDPERHPRDLLGGAAAGARARGVLAPAPPLVLLDEPTMDPPGGTVLSTDRGLFQINSVHDRDISAEEAFDPVHNAGFAFALSNEGQNWSAWSAFNSSAHVKFLEGVQVVKDEGGWKTRKKLWE